MTRPDDPSSTTSGSLDPAYYAALGRAIQVLRVERGLARRELAERAGVSYPYLSEIENGKKRASSESLLGIANALELRPSELMERAEAYRDLPAREELFEGMAPESHLADRLAPSTAMPSLPYADRSAPPSPAPAMAGGQTWVRAAMSAPPESGALKPSRGRSRKQETDPLQDLIELARRLAPDDVERLVDLARRLSR